MIFRYTQQIASGQLPIQGFPVGTDAPGNREMETNVGSFQKLWVQLI